LLRRTHLFDSAKINPFAARPACEAQPRPHIRLNNRAIAAIRIRICTEFHFGEREFKAGDRAKVRQVRSFPLTKKSRRSSECLVADADAREPVSNPACAEMGKIMGKTRKLPQAGERNAENCCLTGTSDDSLAQK
jgi:hypothetical protein